MGIGPLELILVLVIALIVFGPGKLPEIASALGRGVRKFRMAATELTRDFTEEIQEVKGLQKEVTGEIKDIQKEITGEISGLQKEITGEVRDIKQEIGVSPETPEVVAENDDEEI